MPAERPTLRIVRVFNPKLGVAQMCARVERSNGYKFVRIDAVKNPSDTEPYWYVLADNESLDEVALPNTERSTFADTLTVASWKPPEQWGIRV